MKSSGSAEVCGDGAPKMGKTIRGRQKRCTRRDVLLPTLNDDEREEVEVREVGDQRGAAVVHVGVGRERRAGFVLEEEEEEGGEERGVEL